MVAAQGDHPSDDRLASMLEKRIPLASVLASAASERSSSSSRAPRSTTRRAGGRRGRCRGASAFSAAATTSSAASAADHTATRRAGGVERLALDVLEVKFDAALRIAGRFDEN